MKFLPSPGRDHAPARARRPVRAQRQRLLRGRRDPGPLRSDDLASSSCGARIAPRAIARMRRALDEYEVRGIETNLAFHRRCLRHAAFVAGDYDTGFIGATPPSSRRAPTPSASSTPRSSRPRSTPRRPRAAESRGGDRARRPRSSALAPAARCRRLDRAGWRDRRLAPPAIAAAIEHAPRRAVAANRRESTPDDRAMPIATSAQLAIASCQYAPR